MLGDIQLILAWRSAGAAWLFCLHFCLQGAEHFIYHKLTINQKRSFMSVIQQMKYLIFTVILLHFLCSYYWFKMLDEERCIPYWWTFPRTTFAKKNDQKKEKKIPAQPNNGEKNLWDVIDFGAFTGAELSPTSLLLFQKLQLHTREP